MFPVLLKASFRPILTAGKCWTALLSVGWRNAVVRKADILSFSAAEILTFPVEQGSVDETDRRLTHRARACAHGLAGQHCNETER